MSQSRSVGGGEADLDPETIAGWLRRHPRFLADHPEVYRGLTPPSRFHGEAMADHMAAMLHAERAHAAAMTRQADGVLAAGRAAASLGARVQEAVLALIAAADTADCIAAEMPALLHVDAAVLCSEAPFAGARLLPRGTLARLLGGRDVVVRDGLPDDAVLLHGEAAPLARHEAFARVPVAMAPAMITLAARDAATLDPAQGCKALAFLGRVVAALLER